MPIYEYEHIYGTPDDCSERVEVMQKMSDDALTACPECGLAVKRVISLVAGHVDRLAPSRIKELGFKKLTRRDKGTYEVE